MQIDGNALAEGDEISGYRLDRIFEIHEINSLAYIFRHIATGARHLHIENTDRQNCFAVAFKTVPRDSTGVAHILEHTILCGSEKYPVRDPFFSMIKRSLSSFMNALTASDWTMYPFATPNVKDFYNLMDVYLDAVFFPILSELSFKQEGHRLETIPAAGDDGDFQLVYKGVVYNEMKGAMSSPSQIMNRSLLRALYPDTTYSNNSGGEPADIPSLTHEQLKEFHRRHYHPSNAFFYTYGNIPVADHLEFINRRVLSGFTATDPGTEVPSQPRWRQSGTFTAYYPLATNEDPAHKYQACVAWLVGDVLNTFHVFSLSVLEEILLGNHASPLRKALMESGLGSSLSDGTGFDPDLRDPLFACGLKDIQKEDTRTVEGIISDTLSRLAEDGIDRELVDSAIHQIEFQKKEVSNTPFPYGLKLLLSVAGSWLHGTSPENLFKIDNFIERIYREMDQGPFWENLIKTCFLENPHRVTLTLAPDQNLAEREEARERENLLNLKKRLTAADIEKIHQDAGRLEELQSEEEDLSSLPTLERSDIPPDVPFIPESGASEDVFCYPQETSDIFYYAAAAGTGLLPESSLPLVPFFCYVLPKMGTQKRDYAALARYIDLHTGGIGISPQVHTAYLENDPCLPYISLFAKCLNRKQEKLFEIIEELIGQYDFSDLKRLKQLLMEYRAALESSVVSEGHRFSISLASRQFSPAGALSEQWNGIHQLQYLKSLTADPSTDALAALADDLSFIAGTLLRPGNLKTGIVGDENHLARAVDFAASLQSHLKKPVERDGFNAGNVTVTGGLPNEGWATSTAVSFVASAFASVRLGHEDAPALAVISKLLRSSFLHREIREKGGAYGGFALYSPEDGRFCFASYRDPHLEETLTVYQRAIEYIKSGNYSEDDIKESVLQVCSDIDKPETPAERGTRAFHRRLTALTHEKRKAFKQGVMEITRDKVLAAARNHFPESREDLATAVISSEEKLHAANRSLLPPLTISTI